MERQVHECRGENDKVERTRCEWCVVGDYMVVVVVVVVRLILCRGVRTYEETEI